MTTGPGMAEHSAGDPIPAKCAVVRVHVTELRLGADTAPEPGSPQSSGTWTRCRLSVRVTP